MCHAAGASQLLDMAVQVFVLPYLDILMQAATYTTAAFLSLLKPVLVCSIPVPVFLLAGKVSTFRVSGTWGR